MNLWFAFVLFLACFQSLNCREGKENQVSRFSFFDTDLLRYSVENRDGNVVVSPASIKSILSMILEGANGETAAEIRSALRLSSDKEEFREQLNEYLSVLRVQNSQVTLHNANAMFLSNKVKVKKEYVSLLDNVYLSHIWTVNFKEPVHTANLINSWVSDNTKGLIPTLINPENIDPLAEVLLANALYFKSSWRYSFDPRKTQKDCFYKRRVCQMVSMMELNSELNYAYIENLRAHALELPYEIKWMYLVLGGFIKVDSTEDNRKVTHFGCLPSSLLYLKMPRVGAKHEVLCAGWWVESCWPFFGKLLTERYSMILLVPTDQDGIASLMRDLPYVGLSQILAQFEESEVQLYMPKFTIDSNEDMTGILKSMRIKSMFSDGADLSSMFNGTSALVNNLFHKIHLSVDETGTIAAASSSAMLIPLIVNGVRVRIDRPFVFYIRDNKLGHVLFEGKIEEPSNYVEPITKATVTPVLTTQTTEPAPVKKSNSPRSYIRRFLRL